MGFSFWTLGIHYQMIVSNKHQYKIDLHQCIILMVCLDEDKQVKEQPKGYLSKIEKLHDTAVSN